MPTGSDIDADRGQRTRRMIALLTAALFLVASAWNVRGASVIAARDQKTLQEIIEIWVAGYDPNATYSGMTLLAIDRVEMSLLIVGVLLLWAVAVYSTRAALRRAEKNWAKAAGDND